MDFYKRALAPIAKEAWEQIDEMARRVLKSNLSARKLVDVSEPRGFAQSAVGVGRVEAPVGQAENEVSYGIRAVQPLLESRISWELDLWELDNAARGAQNVDLSALEQAARKMALFEERVVYHGFEEARIRGLLPSLEGPPVSFSGELGDFIRNVARAADGMLRQGIEGPYRLAVHPELWSSLLAEARSYPLGDQLEQIVEMPPIFTPTIDAALLLSRRGGDSELTLGADFGLGYVSHDTRKVRLFMTESFTFRVLEPRFAVRIRRG